MKTVYNVGVFQSTHLLAWLELVHQQHQRAGDLHLHYNRAATRLKDESLADGALVLSGWHLKGSALFSAVNLSLQEVRRAGTSGQMSGCKTVDIVF